VEALLRADQRSRDGEFITTSISNAAQVLVDQGGTYRIGERIGPYRLTGTLGYGGMGVVYSAERDDEQYRATVAVKFVRGVLAGPRLLERFRAERQILADLAHPNITRLLDGGAAEDGTPYLVMEYIRGDPIDAHCDRGEVDLPERLRLFQKVCDAVHYAHRALVIHRDLKPSNILVTPEGTPKLVDFGVAKLLTPEPETEASAALLMPAFASPELFRGDPASVATDVYSLGVVLYVLLTGRVPFDTHGMPVGIIERQIREAEPRRPSAVLTGARRAWRREVAGDLDEIVLKAMHKELEQRYQSVAELSEDVGRWLNREPVKARLPTVAYRTGKFVRRHRLAVGSTIAVVLLLGALGGIMAAQSARLARERERSEWLGGLSSTREGPRDNRHRLAVLPFTDLSERGDQRFLSDGLTEQLLNAFTRIPELEVIARTPSFTFQGVDVDPQKAAGELGASLVLKGSVHRDQDRVRITAQLIDAGSGRARWSNSYRREVNDLFSLKEEIALEITGELRLELTGATRRALRQRTTERGDAHALYLRGRYEWNLRSERGVWNAIEAFKAAAVADPDFAEAYAGLADAYRLLPAYGNVAGPEALSLAKAAALRAVALDGELAEAHSALAASTLEFDHDRGAASRAYRRAIALNPRALIALRWYGLFLAGSGNFDSAMVYVERVRGMDPLSPVALGSVGTVHYFARRANEAIGGGSRGFGASPQLGHGSGDARTRALDGRSRRGSHRRVGTGRRSLRRRSQRPRLARHSLCCRGTEAGGRRDGRALGRIERLCTGGCDCRALYGTWGDERGSRVAPARLGAQGYGHQVSQSRPPLRCAAGRA
jgi:TolB-like protein